MKKKNKQLEKITLQDPAEQYLALRNIPCIHLTTKIVREVMGQFITIPIEGNAGWPDLIIFMGPENTFFVEFKLPGETLTESQEEIFPILEKLNYEIYIKYDIRDFIKLIEIKRRKV